MERRPLKNYRRRVYLHVTKLMALWVMIGATVILASHWIGKWEIILLPIIGFVAIIYLDVRRSPRDVVWALLTTRCPQCGAMPLNFKNSDEVSGRDRGLLVCEKCQIEWDLGQDTGSAALGKTGDIFGKTFLDIIDYQVQNHNPPETRLTIERLTSEGHSATEARQLISAPVAVEVFHKFYDRNGFNVERYKWNLNRLPQMPWDANGKELYKA